MLRSTSVFALAVTVALAPSTAATPEGRPRIVVAGHGSIMSDPEMASLTFTVRGEGATSDDAARELVRKREAISEGLVKLLGPTALVSTGGLSIKEARDRSCDREDDQPKLSSGPCAIRGYVASMEGSLKISPVKDAGTALSLATRLGGSNPQLGNFALRDTTSARRQAEAAAIEDAHARAVGIAAATGARLGSLISVEDQAARSADEDIVVTAMRANAPQVMAPPPVAIKLKPEPIETTATLVVTYAVGQ